MEYIGEGQHDGNRLIVRQNVGARSIATSGRFPFRVGIAVPFLSPQKDGMTREDEVTVLERIEDLIYDYFDAKHAGVLCLVLTAQGMREFTVYTETSDVTNLTGSLFQHFPQYDIQHYAELDEEWEGYAQWVL